MARQARSTVIDESVPGVYHVYSRTVRRAFLMGADKVTGKDYSHRLDLLRRIVQTLLKLFAIDMLGYGFMQNHYHEVLRNRPDIVKRMSDHQVALRWCLLNEMGMGVPRLDQTRTPKQTLKLRRRVVAMMKDSKRLDHARSSLSSISVFEQRIKGTIARLANAEDQVSGHFWCGRFEANPIRTPEELLTAMIYVDLNPVRAGIAQTPEESQYTSAYERIHGLTARMRALGQLSGDVDSPAHEVMTNEVSAEANDTEIRTLLDDWLSPIDERREDLPLPATDWLETIIDESWDLWQHVTEGEGPDVVAEDGASTDLPKEDTSSTNLPSLSQLPSRASNKGCLPMSVLDYVTVLDWSGRSLRTNCSGHIPAELPSILSRLGIGDPTEWLKSVHKYAQRLATRFSAPVNQWIEAVHAVVDTATGPVNRPEALL